LKYDWQHFLRGLLHHARSREAEDGKIAKKERRSALPRTVLENVASART
jgi:hypothetical protein